MAFFFDFLDSHTFVPPEERLNRTAAGGLPLSRLSAQTRPKTALSVVNYVGAVRGGLARGCARKVTYVSSQGGRSKNEKRDTPQSMLPLTPNV